MINWKEEIANENYCGCCTGYPPGSNCNGSCFTRTDYSKELVLSFKIDHCKKKLKDIPVQIKILKELKKNYKKE